MVNKEHFYCIATVKCMRGNHPVKEDVIKGSSEEVASILLLKYSNPVTGGLPTKLAGKIVEDYSSKSLGFERLKKNPEQ